MITSQDDPGYCGLGYLFDIDSCLRKVINYTDNTIQDSSNFSSVKRVVRECETDRVTECRLLGGSHQMVKNITLCFLLYIRFTMIN